MVRGRCGRRSSTRQALMKGLLVEEEEEELRWSRPKGDFEMPETDRL